MLPLITSFVESMCNTGMSMMLWSLAKKTHWLAVASPIGLTQFQPHDKGSALAILAAKAIGLCLIKVRYVQISRKEAIPEYSTLLLSSIYRAVFGWIVVCTLLGFHQ